MSQDLLLKFILFTIVLLFIMIEVISLKRKDVYQTTATASKHTLILMLILSFISNNININKMPDVVKGVMNNIIEGERVVIMFFTIYVLLSIVYIVSGRRRYSM